MSVSGQVAEAYETLKHLAARLGIEADRLPVLEESGAIAQPPIEADAGTLGAITQDDLDLWFGRFGQALRIRCAISAGADEPEARVWTATSSQHDVRGLDEVLRYARQSGAELEVGFELDKRRLAARLQEQIAAKIAEVGEARLVLFFSSERLQRILQAYDHRTFESDGSGLGGEAPHPLVILVADADARVRGPWIAVLGRDHQETEDLSAFLLGQRSAESLARVRKVMTQHSNWEESRPRWLTPDYLHTEAGGEEGLGGVRGALVRLENRLVVPYLANRTGPAEHGTVSVFEGPERALEVTLGNECASQQSYELFRWAYGEPEAEVTRLGIVRQVVAARLVTGDKAFGLLQSSGEELRKECEVQLRVLIDRNLVESFERRQAIARQVREYVGRVAERITKLTKEMVDNAYRTAGLLLGVLIAYLLKPDQGPTVLLVTSAFYVAYLLFVRYFYLGSIKREFEAERTEFAGERNAIDGSGVVEIGALTKRVSDRESEFSRRFAQVSGTYLGIAGAAALFAIGWSIVHLGPPSADEARHRALARQAALLEGVGYQDVRADLEAYHPAPPLTVGATGATAVPDLTAVGRDGRLLLLDYVPCTGIGDPEVLDSLRRLVAAGAERHLPVELLVPRACDGELGPESLGAWLAGERLEVSKIWAD